MVTIRSGQLREPLTLQSPTEAISSSGHVKPTYADEANVRGELVSSKSREYFEAAAQHSEMTHLFRIRYYSGITARWRMLWGTRTLNLVGAPIEDMRKSEMLLACKEIT